MKSFHNVADETQNRVQIYPKDFNILEPVLPVETNPPPTPQQNHQVPLSGAPRGFPRIWAHRDSPGVEYQP